ncbi:hypothetical protein DPEC_G00153530 [Dallia pectoralis]|uniref:Uncharacterized protein n=1 Tax=Dallia pectoralis TaxID=75939 RepID=A0ACC2GJT7_DALPE|nr:hypothetical protein DPEC_G00153530 [Dallia pectoralis]
MFRSLRQVTGMTETASLTGTTINPHHSPPHKPSSRDPPPRITAFSLGRRGKATVGSDPINPIDTLCCYHGGRAARKEGGFLLSSRLRPKPSHPGFLYLSPVSEGGWWARPTAGSRHSYGARLSKQHSGSYELSWKWKCQEKHRPDSHCATVFRSKVTSTLIPDRERRLSLSLSVDAEYPGTTAPFEYLPTGAADSCSLRLTEVINGY